MRYFKQIILVVILSAFICLPVRAEMTLNELIFDESKPFHLKILDIIPSEGIIQMGDENAKNTIIEFMDYFCGYCKKVHPELMQIANEREDTRIIFLQHPILSESSKLLANMAIAANIQNKGIDFHNALFEVEGNLNNEKLKQIIKNLELNDAKLNIDITKDEINNIVKLSSFLANGSGARGTPTFFVNEEFVVGYISIDRIKALLK
jgi:protein-disulfide isomerase|tara:strand:- start:83 stop:703 length:621 start_codon:yes stop_codon:yes gene_type:complete